MVKARTRISLRPSFRLPRGERGVLWSSIALYPKASSGVPYTIYLVPQVPDRVVKGGEPPPMDTIAMISFGSVVCAMTALCFIELRRIRKKLESKTESK